MLSEPNETYWSWVPVVGPLIGACLGGFVYKTLVGHHMSDGEEPESETCESQDGKFGKLQEDLKADDARL